MSRYWMLPDDVIELLPEESRRFEALRRRVHDVLVSWGYGFVMPPLVEFLDSLLAGSGSGLDGQTFKITDQASGRLMGIRADMTPQVARIDAHRLPTREESRYAYIGEVLRTRSESTEPRRNTWVAGAELYGVAQASGDIEIMALLLAVLDSAGVQGAVLDIGHAGIYAGLVAYYRLSREDQNVLHDILRGSRRPDLAQWQAESRLPDEFVADVLFLTEPRARHEAFAQLAQRFAGRDGLFDRALADLEAVEQQLGHFCGGQRFMLDFSSTGQYGYHSGLMFACYVPGLYSAIARGGRYDGIGEAYGRSRPATGFSLDLLDLAAVARAAEMPTSSAVQAMPDNRQEFLSVQAKRASGSIIRFQHYPERE